MKTSVVLLCFVSETFQIISLTKHKSTTQTSIILASLCLYQYTNSSSQKSVIFNVQYGA